MCKSKDVNGGRFSPQTNKQTNREGRKEGRKERGRKIKRRWLGGWIQSGSNGAVLYRRTSVCGLSYVIVVIYQAPGGMKYP